MNGKLRADLIRSDTSDAVAIRDLARRVEIASDGQIAFRYSTRPSSVTYYVFTGAPMTQMTREEVVRWLTLVLEAHR